jgi:hypothetical protein
MLTRTLLMAISARLAHHAPNSWQLSTSSSAACGLYRLHCITAVKLWLPSCRDDQLLYQIEQRIANWTAVPSTHFEGWEVGMRWLRRQGC